MTLGQRRGRRRPERLTVFSTVARAELYLETRLIRSAYLVDIGPDQTVIERSAA